MSDRMTILVATVGQGIMYSPDAGESWQRLPEMHSEAMVRSLLVAPGQAGTVYAGTDRGLYESEDAGRHWSLVDSPLSEYAVWSLASDPNNPDVLERSRVRPSTHHLRLKLPETVKTLDFLA